MLQHPARSIAPPSFQVDFRLRQALAEENSTGCQRQREG
jgi:hypothetical protein